MGHQIAVWPFDIPIDSRGATEIYLQLLRGDLSGVQPSENIDKFLQDLTSVFPIPSRDSIVPGNLAWAAPFDRSDRHLIMPVVMDMLTPVCNVVLPLIRRYRLVCFLPSGPSVILPEDEPGEELGVQTEDEILDYLEEVAPEQRALIDTMRQQTEEWKEKKKQMRARNLG